MRTLLLGALSVVAFACASFGEDTLAPAIRKAPEVAFTVPGQGQKLLSQYRGKVVALEFIETWCPHCQAASHVMSRFQNEYGAKGFQALDLAFSENEDLKVADFAKEQQTQFPVGWTTRDQALAFLGLSAVQRFVVPQLILIDREGMIHYQTPPLGDEESYKEDVIRKRIELMLTSSRHQSSSSAAHRAVVARKQ